MLRGRVLWGWRVAGAAVVAFGALAIISPAVSRAASSGPGGFTAVTPYRALDTRFGPGPMGKVGPDQVVDAHVLGIGGVPASGVSAVAVNITATEASAGTYVTAYPSGTTRPLASTLNLGPNDTRPNAATVPVGSDGSISLYNASGSVHLIVDINGWYATTPDRGDHLLDIVPTRALDTRINNQPIDANSSRTLNLQDAVGLPNTATAVALNVTVTDPTDVGYLTVYAAGTARPLASNLNFLPGQTVANSVSVRVSQPGISLYNSTGKTQVVVDVVGFWGPGTNSRYTAVTPARVLDTRTSGHPVAGGTSIDLDLSGVGGIPDRRPAAVMLNLTATQPTEQTYLTIYPAFAPRPTASNLNVPPGDTRPNQVLASVDPGGHVRIYNAAGNVHVIVDVVGWFDRPVFTYEVPGVNGQVQYGGNAVTPADVVVDAQSNYAYITNPAYNEVEILNLTTGYFENPIFVGSYPEGIDITPDGTKLYVANRGGLNISEIDVATRTELRRITVLASSGQLNEGPYSLATLTNGHVLVATTFAGSGYGAHMLDLNPASGVATVRTDFYSSGMTTERTDVNSSADHTTAVITAGDVSSGPVFKYTVASDTFTAASGTGAFLGHIAANANGSRSMANPGAYVFNSSMTQDGTVNNGSGAGVALDAAGTTAYSLETDHIAICDLTRFLVTDVIYTFDNADYYTYLNNHRMALSPDGGTLVALTDSGVTMVRL